MSNQLEHIFEELTRYLYDFQYENSNEKRFNGNSDKKIKGKGMHQEKDVSEFKEVKSKQFVELRLALEPKT